MYKMLINGTEYRLGRDYEISEQAGATAIMQVSVDLEENEIPKPFDSVEIKGEQIDINSDLSDGLEMQTDYLLGDISLAINENLDDTWAMFNGLTWGDIA